MGRWDIVLFFCFKICFWLYDRQHINCMCPELAAVKMDLKYPPRLSPIKLFYNFFNAFRRSYKKIVIFIISDVIFVLKICFFSILQGI